LGPRGVWLKPWLGGWWCETTASTTAVLSCNVYCRAPHPAANAPRRLTNNLYFKNREDAQQIRPLDAVECNSQPHLVRRTQWLSGRNQVEKAHEKLLRSSKSTGDPRKIVFTARALLSGVWALGCKLLFVQGPEQQLGTEPEAQHLQRPRTKQPRKQHQIALCWLKNAVNPCPLAGLPGASLPGIHVVNK
jgi:hypothetical protein